MLPSLRTRRADGMPWTISSSIEVHSVLGKPYKPLNDGVAPGWLRMNRSASASRSAVLTPGRRISRIRARVAATIPPARLMISISRGDLRVIMLSAEDLANTLGNLLNAADGANSPQLLPLLIPLQHWRGLLPVRRQAGGHSLGIVVGPLFQGPALVQTGQDLLIGDHEEHHWARPAAPLREQPLDPFRLGDGADHAVEYYAFAGFGLAQLLPHDPHDDVVAHQVSCLHDRLGTQSERSSPLYGVAEQIAGGEFGEAPGFGQQGTLGSFAGAGRTHE